MREFNVALAAPEWILSATILVVLFQDARTRWDNKGGLGRTTWLGLLLATGCAMLQGWFVDTPATAFLGHYGVDGFSIVCKAIFGATALFVMAMADTWLKRVDRGHGEFRLLALMATLGMFFVCSVRDFAGLFVSLELITVSFYCLTAFKRNDERAIEAGIKYVVLGALATAFLLLGIAFIYGATESLWFHKIALTEASDGVGGNAALLEFGLLLTVLGLCFKIAAVPFQVWTPDVYEGAASPVTAFLSMGSKAAGFVLLLKVVRACLGPDGDAGIILATGAWAGLFALIAAATMLYGNLGALWQGNMKRLLGYSSIGHAGYVLMGVLAFNEAGFAAVVYYLMAYLFTVLGVFAVVIIVNGALRSHAITDYAGLGRKSPFLALVLTCGLLSLAGVPPMAGFFGKFLVFQAVVQLGTPVAYTVAFVGAAGVVVSMYYYLCVVKQLYMVEAPEGDTRLDGLVVAKPLKAVLWVCLIGIFVLGFLVQPFVAMAQDAAEALMAAR